MKLKIVLASTAVVGAAFLGTSGSTVAAATPPALSQTQAAAVPELTITAWVPVPGSYKSWAACMAAGSGSAQEHMCEQMPNGRWKLYVWN
ncbi:hypothetical protein [Amycolatopsis magusensis]|uniref:hypothetical protein n=1 Tax=Amycolatopsis magusensis TaxID=882444 RepID=UPI0024A7E631|nr:hypothetical protein [Amycolatopsis magusensis]MDI5979847.1 hypothetical protein [Amycolatopsis magusensis]